jgi:hypothetical protein
MCRHDKTKTWFRTCANPGTGSAELQEPKFYLG